MDTVKSAQALYKKMGKVFTKLSPWQIYIITSEEDFENIYGKRADKVRRLYNGMIRCNYYQYFKKDDTPRHEKGKE
jgi:putative N6-adenine-specific DNA methylase